MIFEIRHVKKDDPNLTRNTYLFVRDEVDFVDAVNKAIDQNKGFIIASVVRL